MSDNPEDYELVHFGVKGMKWGKRQASKDSNRAQVKSAIDESGGSKGKAATKTLAKRAGQVAALRMGANLVSNIAPPQVRLGITLVKNLGSVALVAAATRDTYAIEKYKED